MGETIIKITDEYFIEVDPLNYTLKWNKEVFDRKTKESKDKTRLETIGHYRTLRDAVESYIKNEQKNMPDCFNGTLFEYVETIEKVTEIAVSNVKGKLNA